MKVISMESKKTGKAVANQIIVTNDGASTFFSYGTAIARKYTKYENGATELDATYWNYSKTTSKYRSQFLGETTEETQAKIDRGEYVLANLN